MQTSTRRCLSSLVALACLAVGLVAIPGTDAMPVVRARSAAALPALRSAPVRDVPVRRPVGRSSSLVHGTGPEASAGLVDAFGFRAADVNEAPEITYPTAPADGSVVTTSTPVLSVQDSWDYEGDPIRYRFKVTTKPDAETGTVVADTAITGTSFTVPDGALRDGVTYFWHTYATDASHPSGTAPGWVQSFRVDYRLGVRPTFAYDSIGPASVNLSSGNLVVSAGSATVGSLGGPVGVSLTYNSQTPPSPGLIGTYTPDPNSNHVVDSGEGAAVVRRDAELAFDWSATPPAPGMTSTNTIVRWVGKVAVPTTGSYLFGATTSDGVKIRVNNSLVVDSWVAQAPGAPVYGSAVSLTAGSPVPITVDWYKGSTGPAVLKLYVKGSGGTSLAESMVPASWFSATAGALPKGWALSTASSLTYVRAEVSDTKVTLIGPDDSTHVFTATGAGFTPPKGEDGVLARDVNGLLTLDDTDGVSYVFDAAGLLRSAVSSSDLKAAHTFTWTTPNGSDLPRLTGITDPVSQRTVVLRYGGETACPSSPPSGFDASAPPGMLCSVELWDGSVTKLWYVSARLGRIENPGASVTDFAYDGDGRIVKIRDSLAADLVAASLRTDDDTTRTLLSYDSSGRVTGVTLGEPTAGAARPGHTYTYTSATETRVHVTGLTEPNGWSRKVALDSAGRQVSDTDATNRTSSLEWDAADRVVASTDGAGLRTTTLYDWAGRVSDTYGPAPLAWFGTDFKPTGTYVSQVPHTTAAYDEGWHGLDAVYFNNENLTGAPVGHTLGVGDGSGAVNGSWAASPPVPGITATDWSARLTGEVLLDVAGTYTFAPNAVKYARLYLDDELVVDTRAASSGTYTNAVAGSRHRIRIEYSTKDSTGSVGTASQTFTYTGSTQNFTVPAGVTSLTVVASGARGGNGMVSDAMAYGGPGGIATSTIGVTPGENLEVRVGGAGTDANLYVAGAGGWNGGGNGGTRWFGGDTGSTGGGGASDLRRGGSALSNRVIVAGGGGGAGGAMGWPYPRPDGGDAGGRAGQAGASASGFPPGMGGTSTAGGTSGWYGGGDGALGTGGTGALAFNNLGGGGGGGGYYGGGGGGASTSGGGGGGGSSWTSGSGSSTSSSTRYGNGVVVLSWPAVKQVGLRWTPPGGAEQAVPGAKLFPRYGLTTSAVDADGRKTATEYADPALALPTASIVDPAGLNLRSTTTYEAVGTGYLRQLTRRLPKGASTEVTYAYYGATEARANPCVSGSTAVNQGGMSKLSTDADPDGSGSQQAIQREQVYDGSGRVVASRLVGDSGWSCTTYDSRGRPVTSQDRLGGTTTISYATPGTVSVTSPDSAGTSRSTSTTVDLLGRTVTYTDELGTQTRPVYDQTGMVVATYRTFSGGSEVQVSSATYDAAGRTLSASDHLTGSARTTTYTYDAAGRLATEVRPNGITTGHVYSATSGQQTQVGSWPTATATGPTTTTTFAYSGGPATFTVPTYATEVTVDAYGAEGGGSAAGLGGHAHATIPVTGGETLGVRVGGHGSTPMMNESGSGFQGGAAGFNGGGSGGAVNGYGAGSGGGGASDVRRGSQALGDRLVAAAGGGGMGYVGGGAGGGATGSAGSSLNGTGGAGGGGTQSAGGAAGTSNGTVPTSGAGALGVGGAGMGTAGYTWAGGGGGGGGGYYGGGGGGTGSDPFYGYNGGGGGGGSSYAAGLDVDLSGSHSGDGIVTITAPSSAIPTWNYTYSSAGRITGKWALRGMPTTYAYDGAGRLVTTVDGPTTRRYAYDADTNRCGLAASCESGWVYDNADRITASPYASAYTYDSHGNLTATTGTSGNPSSAIAYDANDHATVVNDGTSTVTETLSPSGRVLRRVVTTNSTSAVTEDTSYGYSGGGDSPAYSRPTSGGTITTNLMGLSGLTDVGGTGTWSIYDAHGDVQGTTSAAGTFTAVPTADEFGVGTTPASRLGWLGKQQRPSVGGALGLVRMGVRLYDPKLGRFLEVDPIEGGSCSDYDYVCGDPINSFDLNGTMKTPERRVAPKPPSKPAPKPIGGGINASGTDTLRVTVNVPNGGALVQIKLTDLTFVGGSFVVTTSDGTRKVSVASPVGAGTFSRTIQAGFVFDSAGRSTHALEIRVEWSSPAQNTQRGAALQPLFGIQVFLK